MRSLLAMLCAVLCAGLAAHSLAKEAVPVAADPALERRTLHLAEELRCLVCQNQSIADSQAGLAVDLKQQIREQIRAGRTDAQIIEFMVDRYGEFVLYKPPFKFTTLLLWLGPFVLLVAAIAGLYGHIARRRKSVAETELSDTERARAAALLQAADREIA